jgi:hypothetical protein
MDPANLFSEFEAVDELALVAIMVCRSYYLASGLLKGLERGNWLQQLTYSCSY